MRVPRWLLLSFPSVLAGLSGLLVSCETSPGPDPEVARQLIGLTAQKTYCYGDSRAVTRGENGLAIDFKADGTWPPDGEGTFGATAAVTFTGYLPAFSPGSAVDGKLDVKGIAIVQSSGMLVSLSLTVNGTLTVSGDYAGVYRIEEGTLVHSAAGTRLGGTVTVDGRLYPLP